MIKRILFLNMLYILYFYVADASTTENIINEHKVNSSSANEEISIFLPNKIMSKIEDKKNYIFYRNTKKIKNCYDRTIFYVGCAITGTIFISLSLYVLWIKTLNLQLNKKV
jgi:hypothetical protein